MICKKDVILWFKELESYKRIDTMCTLLNMCLPFELRFLGTCLEELGRRDSQELRGMELRVNNPQDLAADIVACQKGEPADKKIRRKMALYLALIRVCNRSCVAEIFRTLEGWGERDFLSMSDPDTLQELLLVYTMAASHPVFSFDQHMKCSEIFEKIKDNKLVCDEPQQIDQPLLSGQPQNPQQPDIRPQLTPSHQELLQQHALHAMHLSGQHSLTHPQMTAASIQVLPQGTISMSFPQSHMPKLIPADGNMQHHITVDGIPHMISSNITTIPGDSSGAILPHPSATWALRPYQSSGPSIEHPPQPSSPMLSQQSSPSNSRTASPNRTTNTNIQGMSQQLLQSHQPQQVRNISQRIGASIKNVRRPSSETTPPPMPQQHSHPQLLSNDLILPQNIKHLDEVVINSDGSGNQLQSLIRNGYTRTGHHPRLKTVTYIPPHQQQQQLQPPLQPQQSQQSPVSQHFQGMPLGNFPVNAGLAYSMQNMCMTEGGGVGMHNIDGGAISSMNSNKTAGSDSGSSIGSNGEISPPETPTLLSNVKSNPGSLRLNSEQQQQQQSKAAKHQHQQLTYKQINMTRLNGRTEKLLSSSGSSGVSAGASIMYVPPSTLVNAHQSLSQPQQQHQHQQLFGTDIVLAPGGNAGGANIMQSSLSNNNNSGGSGVGGCLGTGTGAGNVSSNNNMSTNAVLIGGQSVAGGSGGSGNILGSVITSNSVIMQSHQQPYSATYPYHAAAAQHLASTSRSPLISHNPGMAPPPGSFRLPSFQLPPNGEVIYQTYHPAGGIAFLTSGAPPGAQPVGLRSSNSASGSNPTSQLQQQPQTQPGMPSAALLTSPYSTVTLGGNKPLSCYNCGSQTHSGRDCQEASMDDVTRGAIYKLDYSVSAASANASPTGSIGLNAGSGGSGNGGGVGVSNDAIQQLHHQPKPHSLEGGGAIAASTTLAPVTALHTTIVSPMAGNINK